MQAAVARWHSVVVISAVPQKRPAGQASDCRLSCPKKDQQNRRASPSTLPPKSSGSARLRGDIRNPVRDSSQAYTSGQSNQNQPYGPLESSPNCHRRPQTPWKAPQPSTSLTTRPPKMNHFRRHAQLVPAKPITHPSQMLQGSESDRTTRKQAKRRDRTKSPQEGANQKGSQAKRGNRTGWERFSAHNHWCIGRRSGSSRGGWCRS